MRAKQIIFLLLVTILCIIIGSHIVKRKVDDRKIEPEEQLTTEQPLDDLSFIDKSTPIKVVLNTTGYKSLYHKSIKLTGTTDYTVTTGDTVKNYNKDHILELKNVTATTVIAPKDKKGKITVLSINRGDGIPTYRGILKITKKPKGLVLVNELSIEEYLYGVVPSEMPSNYAIEALKVQAICARSYAIKQMKAGRFKDYNADVDDSVNCQVYKNSKESGRANQAVRDTTGKVITYKGKIIDAYFFSTSYGYTTNISDVWFKTLTDKSPKYLTGKFQGEKQRTYPLENESIFRKFINDPKKFNTFEINENWYRWNIKTDVATMTQTLKELGAEYDIGTLKAINVLTRGAGGVVKKVQLVGKKKSVTIEKEFKIRTVLTPKNATVYGQNNFSKKNITLLPSGYFYVTINKGQIEIIGGGYGHGVGMSQHGANLMADQKYVANDIITHYYTGTKVEAVY